MVVFDSLQKKIVFCIFSAISFVVMAATAIVYMQAQSVIRKDAMNFLDINIATLEKQLESINSRMQNNLLKVSINKKIIEACLSDFNSASYESFLLRKEAGSILENYAAEELYLEKIVVVRKAGEAFSSSSEIVSRNDATSLYSKCIVSEPCKLIDDSYGNLFTCRPIYVNGSNLEAFAVFFLNRSYLDELFTSFQIPNVLLFATYNGEYMLGNHPSLPFDGNMVEDFSEGFFKNRNKYFKAEKNVSGMGINLVGLVPYSILVVDSMKLLKILALVLCGAFVFSLLISYSLSRFVLNDLTKLRVAMLKISQGDIKERAAIPNEKELKDIVVIFNNMMEKIDLLIKDTARAEMQKQRLRQDYLNSQIKPHFIYNTLNTARYIAIKKGEMEFADALSATVELLRAVVGKKDDFVTIRQELDYAKAYVDLQNFRNKSNIRLEVNAMPTCYTFNIPILALQPIVENSCIHGLCDKENGLIEIDIREDKGYVSIRIIDNGVGLDSNLVDGNNCLYGVGINNVTERMSLIYGNQFSSDMGSCESGGTFVELRYPYG